MRKLWTTSDIMYYYDVTKNIVKQWREDGLKCIYLSGGYIYEYKDIVEYLGE